MMLLGSVSSCINCEKFTSTECTNYLDKCHNNGVCRTKIPTGSPQKFTSCNGSELSCDYQVDQPVAPSTGKPQVLLVQGRPQVPQVPPQVQGRWNNNRFI